jgi:glycosyltransferase involved in cell wall biosynthesis
MILAVIARGLQGKPSGRGLVAYEMVVALRRVRPAIEIHLFARADPGCPGVTFHAASGRTLMSDLWRMSRGVSRDIKRLRPDALWCATHLLPLGLPGDLPTIVTLLDVVWRDYPNTMDRRHRLAAAYGGWGLKRAERIVCISEFTGRRLAHYWPRAHVVRLAPGSSTTMRGESDPLNIAGPVVGNVGTVEPRKNLGVLLDAMARLLEATLLQCGAIGWNVNQLVARAGDMQNVHLLGYADERALRSLYRGAAVAARSQVSTRRSTFHRSRRWRLAVPSSPRTFQCIGRFLGTPQFTSVSPILMPLPPPCDV